MGMMPFAKARQTAGTWVAIVTEGHAEIVRDLVEAKPYGVFRYQSSACLRDPDNVLKALAGNAPFIVNRTVTEAVPSD